MTNDLRCTDLATRFFCSSFIIESSIFRFVSKVVRVTTSLFVTLSLERFLLPGPLVGSENQLGVVHDT